MSSAILVKGLCAGYGLGDVLQDITFTAQSGQNVGIIGPNGSGKSTLLRCIAGIIRPSRGELFLPGRGNMKNRAKFMALFTTEKIRPPFFSTLQLALLGRFPWLSWFSSYSHKDRQLAMASLAECGLASMAQIPVVQLSSGQYQLAALARTLTQIRDVPDAILLLDELAANLDLTKRLTTSALLEKWRQRGYTIVQAMHDCNLAALFCTHILGLRGGRQVFFGPVQEVFTEENLSALYDWPLGLQAHPDCGNPQIYPHILPGSAPRTGQNGRNLR